MPESSISASGTETHEVGAIAIVCAQGVKFRPLTPESLSVSLRWHAQYNVLRKSSQSPSSVTCRLTI